MATVEAAIATFERNIEAQTGKSVAAWADLARAEGLAKHGQIVAWLKADHGLVARPRQPHRQACYRGAGNRRCGPTDVRG